MIQLPNRIRNSDTAVEVSSELATTSEQKGWYRRGLRHPPHFDGGTFTQFVTFRLAGTLPSQLLTAWRQDLIQGRVTEDGFHAQIEEYLDAGRGDCWLRDERIASMVQGALCHFDGHRYDLHAWTIMPNHVHVLFTPHEQSPLQAILHSWKSFTSKAANRILARRGEFWQDDYFDRYVRNEGHFLDVVNYVAENPVRAGLCMEATQWRFSFCFRASLVGEMLCEQGGRDARPPEGDGVAT